MKARRTILIAAVALVGLTGSAAPGSADTTQEVAAVDREAYWTRTVTKAAPPLLFDGFPPTTVCLVAGIADLAVLCGEQVTGPVDDLGLGSGLPQPEAPDADLIQPVAPGTLPVGMMTGQERYVSALQFQVPLLEDGQRFGSFELLMRQEPLGFALESETFRELILAAISQVQEQNPEAFLDVLADTASGETALLAETITGIEACPALDPWEGDRAQNAGIDGSRLPDVDCLVGTTGRFDESISSWVFDLTFTAQAWSTGGITGDVLTNQGILLRPLGAENLAYGDPDLSTNWVLALGGEDADPDRSPRIRYTVVSDDAPPVEIVEPIAPTPEIAAPPAPAPGGAVDVAPAQPQIATPAPEPTAVSGAIRARFAERAIGHTDALTSWWLLLLIPIALGGAWMLGEAVIAAPASAGHREGALDELMRRQGGRS